jgi:hypothetical protein
MVRTLVGAAVVMGALWGLLLAATTVLGSAALAPLRWLFGHERGGAARR